MVGELNTKMFENRGMIFKGEMGKIIIIINLNSYLSCNRDVECVGFGKLNVERDWKVCLKYNLGTPSPYHHCHFSFTPHSLAFP
jgi:hypothetical protein